MLETLVAESQSLIANSAILNTYIPSTFYPVLKDMLIGGGVGLVSRAAVDLVWHRFLLGQDPYGFDLRISTKLKAYGNYALYGAAFGALVQPIKYLGEAVIQSLYSRY